MRSLPFLLLFILLFGACATPPPDPMAAWKTAPKEEIASLWAKNESLRIQTADGKDSTKCYDNISLVDLDADGDLDAIYSGASAGEGDITRFFIREEEQLILGNEVMGWIESFDPLKKGFFMDLRDADCCGGYMLHGVTLFGSIEGDSLPLTFHHYWTCHEATLLPEVYFPEPYRFRVQNDQYNLRLTPQIDTTTYNWPMDTNTNAFIQYKTGNTGQALAKATDDTGREWWFVEMDPLPQFNTFKADELGIPPHYRGWMSSRYLKRM